MRTIKFLDATQENFKRFGWLITQPVKPPDIENEYIKYWDRIVPFNSLMEYPNLGFLTCKKRPPVCHKMEVLPNTEEIYICLDAEPAVFFVAPNIDTNPDMSKVTAFLLRGNSVMVRRGIWHWSPFPLYRDSNYALLTTDNCIISKEEKVVVNPKMVLVAELTEPVTIANTVDFVK